ncbi:MAG: transglutaminase domain-containing protein [Lachnospiraceae bacterium]|nr:transglutaminase domain-containing protein [Lachnospiraceae bacterium]
MNLALINNQIKKTEKQLILYITLAVGLFYIGQSDCGIRLNGQVFSFLEDSVICEQAVVSQEMIIQETVQQKTALRETEQQEMVQQEAVQGEAVQEEIVQEETVQEKNPSEMSKDELCQWVVSQIITPDMDDFEKVRAVNQYLCDHMTYDTDYYTTRQAILVGRGRCQGYANAFKDLMNTAGVPTDYIRGYGSPTATSTHAWNRVLIDGTYYYVDVTWNDSNGTDDYLLIGEEEFNRGRTVISYNSKTQ